MASRVLFELVGVHSDTQWHCPVRHQVDTVDADNRSELDVEIGDSLPDVQTSNLYKTEQHHNSQQAIVRSSQRADSNVGHVPDCMQRLYPGRSY